MKTIILVLAIVVITAEVLAQTDIVVRTKDGTYTSFSLSDIDLIDFAPCGIIDYGGQTYYTVKIGNQCWFAQNLNIGTMIPGSSNQTNTGTIEKYCYDNDPNNCTTYGGLYQWDEAMQYATTLGAQGICPTGWHIPTLTEFETLANAVNNDGNTLKAIGQGTGEGVGTNTSGFSALLAGYRYASGDNFYYLSFYGFFWNSTDISEGDAYYRSVYYASSGIGQDTNFKHMGYSVRCLKD